MVLHHIAQGTSTFVIIRARLDAKFFGDRDLHLRDLLAIPYRLEQCIAKAECEQILHGLFTKVMIDAIDLLLVEIRMHEVVQLLRACEVTTEWLLDHKPRPAITFLKFSFAERFDRRRKRDRWDCKIKDAIAC